MKKQILILILIIFSSCGSRKVVVSTIDTSVKKAEVIKTNVNVIKTIDIVKTDTEVTEVITFTPVDPKKESVVDNVVFTNTVIKKEKKSLKSDETIKKAEKDTTEKIEEKKEEVVVKKKDKKIDRKAFSFWNLLWILIPIGVIYWQRKRILKFFSGGFLG